MVRDALVAEAVGLDSIDGSSRSGVDLPACARAAPWPVIRNSIGPGSKPSKPWRRAAAAVRRRLRRRGRAARPPVAAELQVRAGGAHDVVAQPFEAA